jgi:hypothetical protein
VTDANLIPHVVASALRATRTGGPQWPSRAQIELNPAGVCARTGTIQHKEESQMTAQEIVARYYDA